MLLLFASALIGNVPPAPIQAAFKEAVGKELADPYSAHYDWQPIKDEVVYCGWVNAKNQFGAYTGYQPFLALFAVNEKTRKAMVLSAELRPFIVTKMCADKGYQVTR